MTEKQVTPTKVRENIKSYEGQAGKVFVHEITIEGDDIPWEYHSLRPELGDKFTPKVETMAKLEEKQNGKYLNRKISPVKEQPKMGFKQAFKQEPKDQGLITALSVFSSVMNGLQQSSNSLDKNKIEDLCEFGFKWVMGKSTLK